MPYKDRETQLAAQRQHYRDNIDDYRARRTEYRHRNKKYLDDYKIKNGCHLCKEGEPCCLEFHHLDPTQKDLSLSDAKGARWSIKKLDKEIAKCVVLCSNCHRKVHKGLLTL